MTNKQILIKYKKILRSLYDPTKKNLYIRIHRILEEESRKLRMERIPVYLGMAQRGYK